MGKYKGHYKDGEYDGQGTQSHLDGIKYEVDFMDEKKVFSVSLYQNEQAVPVIFAFGL